jgi:hypothetical protein
MLRTLPFASLIFLFSSCTAYQYMTVSSNDMPQNDQREFVVENDSIRLKYRFDGHNAPVQLEVVNKLSKPIYVDWKRSALIMNNRAFSYKAGSLTVSGSTHTSVDNWFSRNNPGLTSATTSSGFSSTVEFPRDLEFIPPTAQINESPLALTASFHTGEKGEFTRVRVPMEDGMMGDVMRATYDEGNSPLKFSSYLTLFVDQDLSKPVVFHHSFYISEILKSSYGPHNFRFFNDREGDRFYLSKSSGVGSGIGVGILAGVTVAAIAAAANNAQPGTSQY